MLSAVQAKGLGHPIHRRFFAEDLVRLRPASARRRQAASQRQGRIDANPHEYHDPDERIADLQYRDAMEFAVGHGTSVHGVMTGRDCRAVETTWMPQCEVERVEPAELTNVELGMEALGAATDAATLRASLSSLVAEYGKWVDEQAAAAPKEKHRAEVAADLLDAARRASELLRIRSARSHKIKGRCQ